MMIEQFMTAILRRLPVQTFSFKRVKNLWTPEEKARFERELERLTERYTLEQLVDSYVSIVEETLEERKYFNEHGDYRCHSFEEINKKYYSNRGEEMVRGYIALSLLEYLWEHILWTHRFFEKAIDEAYGDRYLEIGPGHGKYFVEALNKGHFKEYTAVDVSPTSIEMTREAVRTQNSGGGG